MSEENKEYRCKHCQVQVVGKHDGKIDLRPILGRSHKRNCPRKRNFG